MTEKSCFTCFSYLKDTKSSAPFDDSSIEQSKYIVGSKSDRVEAIVTISNGREDTDIIACWGDNQIITTQTLKEGCDSWHENEHTTEESEITNEGEDYVYIPRERD